MASECQMIAYLGPAGTFSHEAAIGIYGANRLHPSPTIPAVLEAVRSGAMEFGVVPIENSVHGEVTTTMDSLVFDFVNLYVCNEIVVPVSFSAFRKIGDGQPIREVLSHPHALAQCRRFVAESNAIVRAVDSTARACEEVASSPAGLVALSSRSAGALYGLELIASNVEDHPGAATKFYAIGQCYPCPSGNDKSLIVVCPPRHDTGILSSILRSFSTRQLDLESIHSRPLRTSIGRYCFILTVEGHINNQMLLDALSEIISAGNLIKFLGSFPAWGGVVPTAPFEAIRGIVDSRAAFETWIAACGPSVSK